MLTLKDFLTETLTQITDAVVEFESARGETGASANPAMDLKETPNTEIIFGDYRDDMGRRDTVIPILFDIAVSAEDRQTTGAEGGIRVLQAVVTMGGKHERATESLHASRIQFRLPLRLPATDEIGVAAGSRKEAAERAQANQKARAERNRRSVENSWVRNR